MPLDIANALLGAMTQWLGQGAARGFRRFTFGPPTREALNAVVNRAVEPAIRDVVGPDHAAPVLDALKEHLSYRMDLDPAAMADPLKVVRTWLDPFTYPDPRLGGESYLRVHRVNVDELAEQLQRHIMTGILTDAMGGGPLAPLWHELSAAGRERRAVERDRRFAETLTAISEQTGAMMAALNRIAPEKERLPPGVPRQQGPVVDRPELMGALIDQLLGALAGTTVGLTTALNGAGGFGKTTLARQVCGLPQVIERFPGGIFWITLGQEARGAALTSRINDVAERVGGSRPSLTDPEQAGLRLGELLDQLPPTLLVIDDVWQTGQLSPFLSGGVRCARLVTTRVPAALPPGTRTVLVDEMTEEQAALLITHGIELNSSDPIVARMTKAVGRWPLLASLVNAQLKVRIQRQATPHEAADAILSALRVEGPTAMDQSDLLNLNDEQARTRAVRLTVEAGLRLLGPDVRQRFLELGIFPEDTDIHRDVLALLWGRTAGLSPEGTASVCAQFASLSLLADLLEKPPMVRLHDVIRDYARAELGPGGVATHAAILHAAADVLPSGSGGPAWWKIPARADYWWKHVVHHLAEAGQQDALDLLVTEPRWMLARLMAYGPAAVESDLTRSTAVVAPRLRRLIAQNAHVLAPTDPAWALAPTLLSRLEALPSIDTAPAWDELTHPYLRSRWLMPDHFSPALLRTLSGHVGPIRGCAFHPDGAILATAGSDGTSRLWNPHDGRQLHLLDTDRGIALEQCAFHPDGTMLLTVGHGGTATVWNTVSGAPVARLRGHKGVVHAAAFAPDGAFAVTGGGDGTARIWHIPTGEQIRELAAHAGRVLDCAINPNSAIVATAGGDAVIRLWHPRTGDLVGELRAYGPAPVTTCAFSPDGVLLAGGDAEGMVYVWDWAEGRQVYSASTGHAAVQACAFSPAEPLLAVVGTGGGSTWVWNRVTRQKLHLSHGPATDSLICAFSPDGAQLATGDHDASIRLWDPYAAAGMYDIVAHRHAADAVVFSPAGDTLVTTNADGSASVWSADSGGLLSSLDIHAHGGPCAVSPDGRTSAVAGDDGTAAIWDLATGVQRHWLYDPGQDIRACAFTPDGTQLLTGGSRGTITLWSTATGEPGLSLSDEKGHITACAFSPDGALFATGRDYGRVDVWDWRTKTIVRTHFGSVGAITTCAFSADGSLLATAGDRSVRVWPVNAAKGGRKLIRYPSGVPSCAFNPVNGLIASVGGDEMVSVWDPVNGRRLTGIRVARPVRGCAWSPDGRQLAVAGTAGLYMFDFTS